MSYSSGSSSPSLNGPTAGAFRYNTDSSQLEIYDGNQWTGILATSPEQQTGGCRGILAGGYSPSATINTIDYFNISTTGNAIDFGDQTTPRMDNAGCSGSRIRGMFGGGYLPSPQTRYNTIEYVTIASTGDAIDFGDLTRTSNALVNFSSATRAMFAGGYWPSNNRTNIIDYVTIASTGDAKDFGDLDQQTRNAGSCASPTRGIVAGGNSTPDPNGICDHILYVTIATQGNAANFGNLTSARQTPYGSGNAIRGVFSYGYGTSSPNASNAADYITVATLGNAADFGDLINAINHTSGVASSTRIVFAGGGASNVIQYREIMSTGDFVDFGDLITARGSAGTSSNGHGGL